MDSKTSGTRINKYLSEIGHCSRRAADKLIDHGRIQESKKIILSIILTTPGVFFQSED